MSAGLSLIQNLAPTQPTSEPLTSVFSTMGERSGAAWEAAQTPDRYWNVQAARRDRAAKIIDDYHAVTGEKLANPFDMAPTMEEIRANPGQPTTAIYAKRLDVLRQKTTDLRSTMPDVADLPGDYLNADSIDSQIGRESRGARDRENNLMDTGNGLAAFISSAAGEMSSPHGVLSAFLPVSRMPLAAAERTIAGFARNVGREALFQGGVNLAAQIPASVIDYNTRKATGTEQIPDQLVEEFVGAAAGGAMLGGLFRGAHLTVRRLQGKGIELPPAVRDAALVVESRDLYGDKNALGVPAAAHEAALDRAVADVSRGRAADVADIVNTTHPTIASATKAAADLGSLSDIAGRYLQNPDGVHAQLDAARESVRVAEGELATKYGVSRNKLYDVEDLATPEENQFLFYGDHPTSVAAIDEIRDQLSPVDSLKEAAREVYYVLNKLPDDLSNMSRSDELALMRLKVLGGEIDRMGGNLPDVMKDAFTQFAGRFRDLNDAEFMVDSALGRLKALHDAGFEMKSTAPAEMARLEKMMDEPSAVTEPFTPPEEPGAGRPTGESPQDKTMQAQVKQLLDEGGGATPAQRQQYEAVTKQEKETRAAIACLGGGSL